MNWLRLTSDFSNDYRNEHNAKVMKMMLLVFALHLPLGAFLSHYYKTSQMVALTLNAMILISSLTTFKFLNRSNLLYIVFGVNTSICSAMVIYAGRGLPEFHYHIFAMMSFLIAFASPLAVLASVVAIAIHHLTTYFFIPGAAFPIEYSLELFIVHICAAVFQGVPGIIISRAGAFIVDTQGKLLGDLRRVADENGVTSSSLDNSMRTIADNTSRQTESMGQASSAVTEIEGMMKRNKENIEETNKGTQRAVELLNETKEKISAVHVTMENLSSDNKDAIESLNEGAQELSEMVELMENVAARSKMINDIVFQTKLLSFNASVESARAGEMGKGFAVVAEEVGNLAASSGQAALEINALVERARGKIHEVSTSLQDKIFTLGEKSNTGIKTGLGLARESDEYITQAVGHVDKIRSSSEDIETASSELLVGLGKIQESLNLLGNTIQSTNSMTSNTLSLSTKVNKSSEELNVLLKKAS